MMNESVSEYTRTRIGTEISSRTVNNPIKLDEKLINYIQSISNLLATVNELSTNNYNEEDFKVKVNNLMTNLIYFENYDDELKHALNIKMFHFIKAKIKDLKDLNKEKKNKSKINNDSVNNDSFIKALRANTKIVMDEK